LKPIICQPTRRKFQRIWDQPLGIRDKKMESFMSWVLKTELHYLALLLFAEIHIPPTVPLVPLLLDWYFWGRNGPFYAMYHATKTRKMLIHVAGDLQLELHQKTLHYISSQNYPLQALLVILWSTQEKFWRHDYGRPYDRLFKYRNGRSWRNDCPRSNDFDYLEGRLYAPKGAAWDTAVAYWKTLKQMQMQNLMKKSTLTLLTLNQWLPTELTQEWD
jgi:hypothetical protein